MGVIGDKDPGKATRLSLLNDLPLSVQEIFTVPVIFKNCSPFDPPHHDMMQGSRSI